MRTHATFRSGRFDPGARGHAGAEVATSSHAPPGDDLIRWLGDALARVPGLVVDRPVQEEWGWVATVRAGEQAVAVHAGLMGLETTVWLVVVRPLVSARSDRSGRMDQHGVQHIIERVHRLLILAPDVHEVGWHQGDVFDRGVLEPTPTPFTEPPPERP